MIDYTAHDDDAPKSNGQRVKTATSESKDFRYYYSILLNKWYWLAIGLVMGLTAYYVSMRYATNQYKISGSVLIEDVEQKNVSKEAITRELGFDKNESNVEDRIRMMTSTELMHRIVDSLDLNVSYIQEGYVKTHELFGNNPVRLLYWNTEGSEKSFQLKVKHYDSLRFTLFRTPEQTELVNYGMPFSYGKHELVIKRTALPPDANPVSIVVKDDYEVAEALSSRLDIVQLGRSNILSVSMIDEVPERAVAVVNRLVREYGIAMLESKNDAGRKTMNFIQQRLSYVATEL